MRLFWTHDQDREFNGFTRVFPTFLIEFFSLDFILQHRVDWELDFVICFYLHFMRLSLSHDSGHWFSELTRVDSSCFLCHFLFVFLILSHPSMSSWLRIGFHNFFQFTFYEVILISWFRPHGWQLKLVDSSFFFLFLFFF
jgi:hypothetical protein